MSQFTTINILDMLETFGESELNLILSDFSCSKNAEIEHFIRHNAVEFAKKKISVTYLIVNENGRIAAIFTLAHKAVKIHGEILSASLKKKIERYAPLDKASNSYLVSAFLIAQFGKNDTAEDSLSGNTLMDCTMDILRDVQHYIGGGIVYLECEEEPKLLHFYQNSHNCFRFFSERYSEREQIKYIQLLKII